jgi:hypothetical protein
MNVSGAFSRYYELYAGDIFNLYRFVETNRIIKFMLLKCFIPSGNNHRSTGHFEKKGKMLLF